jgi:phosphoribosyl 1,2-cyclic phosphodiesterase
MTPKGVEHTLRYTVLASGSGGNASLVESDGFGVLIDTGLGSRLLADRFAAADLSWSAVQAVVLTHTHTDHWKDTALAQLHRLGIPLFCHLGHYRTLSTYSPAFAQLLSSGLVRPFDEHRPFDLSNRLRCTPLPIRHDAGPTFAFRFEAGGDLFGPAVALGYAADLGCWDDGLAEALTDVDLLAVEFNHDVEMERTSGRGAHLIARVLGDEGHLSNDQAAALLRTVLRRSATGRLRHLVQLHLSRDCNRPALARAAARPVLDELAPEVRLHTADQDTPSPTLHLGKGKVRRRGTTRRRRGAAPTEQAWLPGWNWDNAGQVG